MLRSAPIASIIGFLISGLSKKKPPPKNIGKKGIGTQKSSALLSSASRVDPLASVWPCRVYRRVAAARPAASKRKKCSSISSLQFAIPSPGTCFPAFHGHHILHFVSVLPSATSRRRYARDAPASASPASVVASAVTRFGIPIPVRRARARLSNPPRYM